MADQDQMTMDRGKFTQAQKAFNSMLVGSKGSPMQPEPAAEAPPVDKHAADKAAARQLEALFAAQNAQPQVAPMAPDPELEEVGAAPSAPAMELSPVAAPQLKQALGKKQAMSREAAEALMERAIQNAPKSGPGYIR